MRYLLVICLCILIVVALADESKEKKGKGSGEKKGKGSDEKKGKGSKENGSGEKDGKGSGEKGVDKGGVNKYCYYPSKGTIIYNQKTQIVFYVDFELEYFAWYSGQLGVIYLYIRQERQIFLITSSFYETWETKKRSYDDYFADIYLLKDLYENTRRFSIAYNARTITEQLEKQFIQIIGSLSVDYAVSCRAFQYVEETATYLYESRVDNFEKVYKNYDFELSYDANWYLEIIYSRTSFFEKISGGWETIVKNGVQFELDVISQFDSGFSYFNYYCRQFAAAKIELKDEFTSDVSTEVGSLGLITSLTGQISYGYAGFTSVVYSCARYAYGEISEDYLVLLLRTYFTNKRAVKTFDYGKAWSTSIVETKETIESLELTENWKVFYEVLVNIEKSSWYVNDIDLIAVIQIIIETKWTEADVQKVVKKLKEKREGGGKSKERK